eukprot:2631664-Amphidinium_carterae.1
MKKGHNAKGKGTGALMSPTSFGGTPSYYDFDPNYPYEETDTDWNNFGAEAGWTGYEAETEWETDETYFQKGKRKKGKTKGKGHGSHNAMTSSSPSQPIASSYPATATKKGRCFRCGQEGHWKDECPLKRSTMYIEQEQQQQPGATANPLFWTTGEIEGMYPLTEECDGLQTQDVEVIEVGAELPSEPCEPPAFLTYMLTASDPETLSGDWSLPPASASAATPSLPAGATSAAALSPGTQITVSGTLQVQGTLTVDDQNQTHLHITSLASQGQHVGSTQRPPSAPATSPMAQSVTGNSMIIPNEERTKETTTHLMSLFGTSVQIAAPAPKNRGQRQETQHTAPAQQPSMQQQLSQQQSSQPSQYQPIKPGHGTLDESDDVALFVENHTCSASALPVFTMPLGADDQAFATKTLTSSAASLKPSHSRALSSCSDRCTLLPDTGAVDNLIGSQQAARFNDVAKQVKPVKAKVTWSVLKQPRLVSGVGGSAQVIRHQMTVVGQITPTLHMKYTAPVVEGDSCGIPALLGLSEMKQAGCIFLPQSKRLMVLPSHVSDNEIIFPTGTKTVLLETSPSGHMLIPFLTKHDNARRDTNHHQHHLLQIPAEGQAYGIAVGAYSSLTSSGPGVSHEPSAADGTEGKQETVNHEQKSATSEVSEVHLTANSRERAAHRKQVLNLVEELLVDHHIRRAPTRTNIYGENVRGHSFAPGSVLYGAYTRRGKGITQETEKGLEIVAALTKLATCRPLSRKSMPFSSIQVTCSQANEGLSAHQDAGNFGLSDIIGLGAYEGGQLWVSSSSGHERLPEKLQPIHERISPNHLRGTWHDIKRKWLVFDGKAWHCSRPYTGRRISVIFFNPSGIHTLSPAAHQRLQQLGFLVPQRPHEEQSWLAAVDVEHVDLQYALNPAGHHEKTAIVVAEKLRQLADCLHQDGFHILRTSHAHSPARLDDDQAGHCR